jgi:hypothetical protein
MIKMGSVLASSLLVVDLRNIGKRDDDAQFEVMRNARATTKRETMSPPLVVGSLANQCHHRTRPTMPFHSPIYFSSPF